ncbi:Ras guanine nucleotide exchange factor bud5 [Balamuthia mandrillaris]
MEQRAGRSGTIGVAAGADGPAPEISKTQAFESLAKTMVATKDDENMKAFLLTYPMFLPAEGDMAQLPCWRFRMLDFVKIWWECYPQDFNYTNVNLLLNTIREHKPDALNAFKLLSLRVTSAPTQQQPHTSLAQQQHQATRGSSSSTSDELSETTEEEKEEMGTAKPRLTSFASQISQRRGSLTDGVASTSKAVDFMDIASNTLAREMTMLDFELFRQINPRELLYYVRYPAERNTRSPNVTTYISRFNELSYWVVTEILMTRKKDQTAVLRKFIRLASCFLQLNNFNSVITILSALNNSTIRRLRDTWDLLSEKDMALFRSLEDLFSSQQNFSSYFQEFKKRPFPKLPYFALFLRDCTFILDGNKPYTRSGMINFEFMSMMNRCLQPLNECQAHEYEFAHSKEAQSFLSNIHFIDDEDALYLLSLKAQPSIWTNDAVGEVVQDEEDSSESVSSSDNPVPASDSQASSDATFEEATDDEGNQVKKSVSKAKSSHEGQGDSKEAAKPKKKSKKKRHLLTLDTEALIRDKMVIRSIKNVPPHLVPLVYKAERYVDGYFSNCVRSVDNGTISINVGNWLKNSSNVAVEERLILVRASAMSVDFFTSLRENFGFFGVHKKQLTTAGQRSQANYVLSGFAQQGKLGEENEETASGSVYQDYTEELTAKLLYDFGYVSGMGDCRAFSKYSGKTGMDLYGLGPMMFVYSGRSTLDMKDAFLTVTEDVFRSIGKQPFSFEADAWRKRKIPPPKLHPSVRKVPGDKKEEKYTTVCNYWCGFAAGWTDACFNTKFCCVELFCRARGDPYCYCIVTYPHQAETHVKECYKSFGLPDKSSQLVQFHAMDAKEAFTASTKALLSERQADTPPASKRGGTSQQKNKAGVTVNFPIVGRKQLPKRIESKLENAHLISTISSEDLAKQEELKANMTTRYTQLFSTLVCSPSKGEVILNGEERYVFLRAETLATTFFKVVRDLLVEQGDDRRKLKEQESIARSFATNFLYDFGRCFAQSDYKFFDRVVPIASKFELEDYFLLKIFSLPKILQHLGWGKLSIASSLSLLNFDFKNKFKNFFIRYTVKNSFEASAYINAQREEDSDQKGKRQHSSRPHSPVCILNCGYVNSYLEECISATAHRAGVESTVQLGTVEVSCVAMGHQACEFLVAPADLIYAHTARYLKEVGREEDLPQLQGLEIVMRRFKDGRGYFSRLFRK